MSSSLSKFLAPFRGRPLIAVFLLLLLLFPFTLGFFLKEPVKKQEDFAAAEEELRLALEETKAASSTADDDTARMQILFLETALTYEFDVWNSELLTTLAGTMANNLLEREKEVTPERACLLQKRHDALHLILQNRDSEGYLSYLTETMIEDGTDAKTAEQTAFQIRLRIAARDESYGKKVLLEELAALQLSLETGIQSYHPATKGAPLTEADRAELETLLRLRTAALDENAFDPVPANSQSLRFWEDVFSLLWGIFSLFLFLPLLQKEGRRAACPIATIFLTVTALSGAFFSLTVHLLSPASAVPCYLSVWGETLALPLTLTVICHLILQGLPFLLLLILCRAAVAYLREKICLAVTCALVLLFTPLSFFARLLWANSSLRLLLPSVYLDLDALLLPEMPRNTAAAAGPFSSLFVYSCLVLLALWLLKKKKKV